MKKTKRKIKIFNQILEVSPSIQLCPVCGSQMGIMPGTRDAICKNCGYKDPCCE